MRLILNGVAARIGGGIRVLAGLGESLVETAGVDCQIALSADLANHSEVSRLRGRVHWVRASSIAARLVWESTVLPSRLSRGDTLLGLSNTLPAIRKPGVVHSVLIQNVAPLLPEVRGLYRGKQRARLDALRWWTLRSVRSAAATFVFTQSSAEVVTSWVPTTRIHVLPPATELQTVPRGAGPSDPYFVIVGDLYRYKGVEDAVRALTHPKLAVQHLLMCGSWVEQDYVEEILHLAEHIGVDKRVHLLGPTPHAEVLGLIKGADALISSSRAESLCFPLLDGLALGTPIVSSDIPVAREVCGNHALFYEARDAAQLSTHLTTLSRQRSQTVHRGWGPAATRLLEVIRELVA